MTAHILLTFITLILFTFSLRNILKNKSNYFPWGILVTILFLIFPISFAGITVIAHFLFEMSSDNLLWYMCSYAFLWIFAGRYLYMLRSGDIKNNKYWYSFLIIWLIYGIWYIFALTQSGYEPGAKTPEFTDTAELISYWASIQLYVITLFWILIDYSLKKKKKYSITVITLFLAIYIFILFGTFI